MDISAFEFQAASVPLSVSIAARNADGSVVAGFSNIQAGYFTLLANTNLQTVSELLIFTRSSSPTINKLF